MEIKENAYKMGQATYVIHRVFVGKKTPHEVIAEEIISTAKQAINSDRSGKRMV